MTPHPRSASQWAARRRWYGRVATEAIGGWVEMGRNRLMEQGHASQSMRQARIAGLSYLIVIAGGLFAEVFVRDR